MFSNTVIESNSAAPWKTIPIFCRTSSASSNVRLVMSSPSMSTRPLSGTSSRRMSLSVVDFPVPDSPTMHDRLALVARRTRRPRESGVEGERHVLELDDRLARLATRSCVSARSAARSANRRAQLVADRRARDCGSPSPALRAAILLALGRGAGSLSVSSRASSVMAEAARAGSA